MAEPKRGADWAAPGVERPEWNDSGGEPVAAFRRSNHRGVSNRIEVVLFDPGSIPDLKLYSFFGIEFFDAICYLAYIPYGEKTPLY